MTNLEIAKRIVKENIAYGDCGIYNTRSMADDDMTTLYNENGLQIDICYFWSYFEVFGLPRNEFFELEKYYNEIS